MHRVPYRSMAGQFGLSPSALSRHLQHLARQRHLQPRHYDQSHQATLLETRLDRLFNSTSASSPFWNSASWTRGPLPDSAVPQPPRPPNEICCKSSGLPLEPLRCPAAPMLHYLRSKLAD
jgi:hypothetical protein